METTKYKVQFVSKKTHGRQYFALKGFEFASVFEALACGYGLPGRPMFKIVKVVKAA